MLELVEAAQSKSSHTFKPHHLQIATNKLLRMQGVVAELRIDPCDLSLSHRRQIFFVISSPGHGHGLSDVLKATFKKIPHWEKKQGEICSRLSKIWDDTTGCTNFTQRCAKFTQALYKLPARLSKICTTGCVVPYFTQVFLECIPVLFSHCTFN